MLCLPVSDAGEGGNMIYLHGDDEDEALDWVLWPDTQLDQL